MTKLSELLSERLITLNVKAESSAEAIRKTIHPLQTDKRVEDFEKFEREVLQRETVESTCLGCGVALPHARIDVVNDMVLAVGISPDGILFENGNQIVSLIFVVGTPKRLATEYLRMVGTIAKLLKDGEFRESLLQSQSPAEFINIVIQREMLS